MRVCSGSEVMSNPHQASWPISYLAMYDKMRCNRVSNDTPSRTLVELYPTDCITLSPVMSEFTYALWRFNITTITASCAAIYKTPSQIIGGCLSRFEEYYHRGEQLRSSAPPQQAQDELTLRLHFDQRSFHIDQHWRHAVYDEEQSERIPTNPTNRLAVA